MAANAWDRPSTTRDPYGPSGLTRWFFAELPVGAARRGLGALMTVSDGHPLSALGRLGGLAPIVALVFGFGLGWRHWFFDTVFTESTGLVIALAVIGVASTQLGMLTAAGFILGDFLLFHTTWFLPAPETYDGGGPESVGILAGLWYERIPLLSEYVLLVSLMVLVPLSAGTLASSLQARVRGPQVLQLFVGADPRGRRLFVLMRFWSNAAPHVIDQAGLRPPRPLGEREITPGRSDRARAGQRHHPPGGRCRPLRQVRPRRPAAPLGPGAPAGQRSRA